MSSQPAPDLTSGPIAWMTRHSVAPNLLMLFLLIGGFFMARTIKQEVFPEFEIDVVTITVPYPGASPEEVEQGIVLAIEEAVRGLDGVDQVIAAAHEGSAAVSVELEEGIDRQRVYQEIQQEIDRITTFPEDAEEPEVVLESRRHEVVNLAVFGDADELILRDLAETIRDQLLQNREITQVDIVPERVFEVSIQVPQENLRAYNLTLQQIANTVRSASVEIPGGSVKTTGGEILLRMKERRDWARQFGQIPIVTSAEGTELRVCDLGTVTDTFEETYQVFTCNGKPAVSLQVFRVADQTPIGVSDAVRSMLPEVEANLPPGIGINIIHDASDIFRQRLELLLRNGLLGLILVLAILTFFLEHKLAFWVTMGIPISFMGAFLVLPSFDITVNMISMFAFIIALGIVVDDAIVVGENIFECRQQGMGLLDAAIKGAKDVAIPVTFSILTNLAAFAPLAFVPGFMGKVFCVIPVVVSSVFIISLVESLLVLPTHLAHSKREGGTFIGRGIHRVHDRLSASISRLIEQRFGPFLAFVVRFRYLTVSIALAVFIFVGGYVASGRMGLVLMPKVEGDEVDATAVLPYGSPLDRLIQVRDILVDSLNDVAARNGQDKLLHTITAQIAENQISVTGFLTEPHIRPIATESVTKLWRDSVGQLEGLESLRFQSDRRGPGSGKAITIELSHRNINTLDRASTDLAEALAQFGNVRDIDDGYAPGKQQLDYRMLPEGRSLGLTADEVARQLRGAFYGVEALRQQRGRNEVKVMVRLPKEQRVSEYNIESFIIQTPTGIDVPLGHVTEVERGRSYTVITRRDGRRTVSVTADVVPQDDTDLVLNTATETILPKLMDRYPHLTYSFQGRQEDMRESISSLKGGFALALMIIYVLLGIPFRSYIQPLIVMTSIPFGIVGAVLGHLLMGYSLSIISMMGLIALSGVVVNDALVLIDYANTLRAKGMPAKEAILTAGVRRFRPVLLTTITTFGGLAPMIFETSRQARFMIPMAISLGYGILFATTITLLLIPCLYSILEDIKTLFVASTTSGSMPAESPTPDPKPSSEPSRMC